MGGRKTSPTQVQSKDRLVLRTAENISPIHCQASADDFSFAPAFDLPCGSDLHVQIDLAMDAAKSWMKKVSNELRIKRFAKIDIPATAGLNSFFSRLLDTEQTAFVIARARGNEKASHWLYLGLLTQSTQGRWLGICGFFIPGCNECDNLGTVKARLLQNDLKNEGWNSNPISRLPAGLCPGPNWFEDRMIAVISQGPLRSRWQELTQRVDRFTHLEAAPAIVRIGAGLTGYRGFVSTDDLKADANLLRQLSISQNSHTFDRSRSTYRLIPKELGHEWAPMTDIARKVFKLGFGKTGRIPARAGALFDGQKIRVSINLRALAFNRGIAEGHYVTIPVENGIVSVKDLSLAADYLCASQEQLPTSTASISQLGESSSHFVCRVNS